MEKMAETGNFQPQPAQPRYHIVSMRVSDAEKALLDEISLRKQISITNLMRLAFQSYLCVEHG